jgi:RimK family alpha-L-glutamate ligase
MLDLLVFTQYPRSYGPQRFKEEALKMGLDCKIKSYKYVDLDNLPDAKHVILREPTASKNIYDLRDKLLHHYINQKSVILNQYSYLKWSVLDKKTQELEFKKGNIPHVKSIDPDLHAYPFVVKSKLGSHGSHVFKIKKDSDLEAVYRKGYSKKDLLFQEFLASGFDLRVIVLYGKVLGVMMRTPLAGQFLSNYSQGGEVSVYEGNDKTEIIKIAEKAAKHFMLDYVGVDLMKGGGGDWKVLEVNRGCQFKGFESSTGINVAREVLLKLLS